MIASDAPSLLKHRSIALALKPGVLLLGAALSCGVHAETIVGLTNTQQLSIFDSGTPGNGSSLVSITGLQTNEVIFGIDYRPTTGLLYGLGSANRLYTLNASTGAATFVASLTNAANGTPYALAGAAYGVDFNPVPDREMILPSLRITGNTGENLRINVNGANAGQVSIDAALNNGTQTSPSIAGSAYTNPDTIAATGTALFTIDFITDSVYRQDPPNAGTLSIPAGNVALGVDTTGQVGYDISISGMSYASLTSPITGKSSLYTIGGNGAATLVGAFGIGGNLAIAPSLSDIAVTPVPEPAEYALFAAGLSIVALAVRRRRNKEASAT